MTIEGQDFPRVLDLRLARAFVELGGAYPNMATDQDEPTPAVSELGLSVADHRWWGRLTDLCLELLNIDAAALFLLNDDHELQLVIDTNAQAEPGETTSAPPRPARRAPVPGRNRSTKNAVPAAQVTDLISNDAIEARHPGWVPAPGERTRLHLRALLLHQQGSPLGTLDLLSRGRGPLPPSDIALGQALADVAAATAMDRRSIRSGKVVNQQLQTALDSRVIIEQAKGMLSQSHRISLNAAFDLMRRYSRRRHIPLREVARRVVVNGGAFMIHNDLTA